MTEPIQLKVCITRKESRHAREFANSKGYTYQGWVGMLIREALQAAAQRPVTDREER